MKNCIKNNLSGLMLTAGFLFIGLGLSAQNINTQKHVQIKISENGKTITDTTFDVNSNVDPNELQSLLHEFNDSSLIMNFDDKMPFSNFDDDFFDFNFNGTMPGHMFRFRQQVDSLMGHHHEFDFSFDADSIFKEFGTFGFSVDSMNNGNTKSFAFKFNKHDIDSVPGLRPGEKKGKFYYYNSDIDNRIVSCDTITKDDNVLVLKKIFPDKQQIIVEKNNPDVIIKKEKNGDIEITIKKKEDKNI